MDRAGFKRLLEQELDRWLDQGWSPESINRGHCESFAREVVAKVRQHHGEAEIHVNWKSEGHFWILFQGQHYDAECTDGVHDWRDLPFFRRNPDCILEPASRNERMREMENLLEDLGVKRT